MTPSAHELLQIQQAAKGCVSGTLAEWPYLKDALKVQGIFLPDSAPASELVKVCKVWLEQNEIETHV
jgi:hypothetical protein